MEKEIMERDYQCCNYCIMDTSDPTIRFNKKEDAITVGRQRSN